ncbi:SDR family oxidoreductase [Bradyrhizobium sp. 182]|uniref:SDR family NAD(P)-dependent oxidoreductase n=1 Tax=unclassified Bradyrhizobium TaxID=2631580 RepID=UPI001FF9F234|nr:MULTISPECIES: SDR family NAD(P)-dependent oxidoreductase [unclassified Bradyrhizobium]MCK1422491.1 SDR family oxidoreductase [Bradyrhizobium sp. CW12]MCK1528004.1 SDR family oxidoreductase [Bradyrhizobium sp. 182]MCK1648915.1 SDR family oxidoreductase [Bradyrhizobium sp. 154]
MTADDRPVALVTGGGGDIGRAIALRLAQMSNAIAIVDRERAAAEASARLLEQAGGRALAIVADVASAADTAAFVETVERRLGPIGIFANNAGIEGVVAPLHDYPDEAFDQVLQVNVKGVFLGLKHVLARMIRRGTGAIINTASTSAIRGRAGLAGYVASKHAVLGLTRTAALEVKGTGIRVNAVLPGPIKSRMIRGLDNQARDNAVALRRQGEGVHGRPQDVASTVAFLASEEAAHLNGAALVVDGGMTVA